MVVDTSALVAILLGEEQADALSQSLASVDAAVISAPNWLEAMILEAAVDRFPSLATPFAHCDFCTRPSSPLR